MKIDCYLSEHCGSQRELHENIKQALSDLGLRADIIFHTIYYDDAVSERITGSPTIRVNGSDLFDSSGTPGIS